MGYEKAQEQAMSKDERIQYMKQMISKKEKELSEQKAYASHLSSQVRESKDQVVAMRKALTKATYKLLSLDKDIYKDTELSPKVQSELQNQITSQKKTIEKHRSSGGMKEIQKELARLEQVLVNCEKKSYFIAWLFLSSLDPMIQIDVGDCN